jgi:hypothetical protein
MGRRHIHPDNQSILERVLDSNECRLDRLDGHGIEFAIDGAAVLQFLFQRVLASRTTHDFRLNWAMNVAGLLDEVETQTLVTRVSLSRAPFERRTAIWPGTLSAKVP